MTLRPWQEHPATRDEYLDAVAWYESQEAGLGERLAGNLDAAVGSNHSFSGRRRDRNIVGKLAISGGLPQRDELVGRPEENNRRRDLAAQRQVGGKVAVGGNDDPPISSANAAMVSSEAHPGRVDGDAIGGHASSVSGRRGLAWIPGRSATSAPGAHSSTLIRAESMRAVSSSRSAPAC